MSPSAREALRAVVDTARTVNRTDRVVDAVRTLRGVLPGDPTFGDPLSTAGPGTARLVARVTDRLQSEEPGAAKEVSLGALQVWQALLERTGRGRGERDVTIVFTDLVGFSTWSLSAGDAATLILLKQVARAVERPMQDRGGHIVKRLGDGVMAVFPSADNAVGAVFDARDALARVSVDGYTPRMRVGIHTGRPRAVGSDWLGVDVTVSARVMQAGADGNVMISSAALDTVSPEVLAALRLSAKPYRRGLFSPKLDGVPDGLRINRLVQAPER
ncbi:adenylate cyclase [Rhodococcoides kroppenstedtii]|uniref:Adenylate cyclase n=1 Tax=Rhodococcoides kroppenstedtii TaxID=293050 RepID=A0A1I0T613_9NOCA|nr:adenylate/guanylate cyclase domain-containing protein [Rhodococcus kroppenstedtii]SFA47192.1 adenylate cyclase [Rhodococcus kroppenstedtii]